MPVRLVALLAVGLCFPGTAFGHSIAPELGEFFEGALHPVMSLEAGASLLSLALLAATVHLCSARTLLLVLMAGCLFGGLVQFAATAPDERFLLAALSLLTMFAGALVAFGPNRVSPMFALTCAAASSAVLTIWIMAGMAPASNPLPFFLGSSASIGLLVLNTGAALRLFARPQIQWRDISLRTLGSWIAALSLLVAAVRL